MYNWPQDLLPLPSFNLDVTDDFANVRSEMDSGRARQRPRYTNENEFHSVVFQLDKQELAYFKAVWVHKLNNGNDWFNMRLPAPDGESLTLQELRFTGDISRTHLAFENWEVSVDIEIRNPLTISESALDAGGTPPTNGIIYGGEYLYFEGQYLTYNP